MGVSVDQLAQLRDLPDVTVPCDGCTRCCESAKIIPLLPEETHKFPHTVKDDTVVLVMREDGKCIYLNDTGCFAHADKPIACRTFDCAAITQVVEDYRPYMSWGAHQSALKLMEEGYVPVIPIKLKEFLG